MQIHNAHFLGKKNWSLSSQAENKHGCYKKAESEHKEENEWGN